VTNFVQSNGTQPLLRWPGGKRKLLKHILPLIPTQFGNYLEPFAGGAALFFKLAPLNGLLSDTNRELINCYHVVRDSPDILISLLSELRNSEDDYYQVRAWTPAGLVEQAARTIYLSNLSFNGIHRVNLRGQFNVPYNHLVKKLPFDENLIWRTAAVLRSAHIACLDFEVAVSSAECGDLVYFDPPYTVLHGSNGFIKYNERIFSWADQERLARVAVELADAGCHVIVSNADHLSVRRLYPTFSVQTIERISRMAANGAFRRPVTECIFWR
jgi:DNA adenine methylase